jgi:recombination-promoting nuclease RpnB
MDKTTTQQKAKRRRNKSSGKTNNQPFDKLLKATLQNLERARVFLEIYLSSNVKKYIDLSKIELIDKEFIAEEFRKLQSDVILRVTAKGAIGYVYCLIEGQSTADPLLPLRILQYNIALMIWHFQNVEAEIPPITTLVIYNGEDSPYPHPINFLEMLEKNKVAKELLFNGTQLVDLTVLSDEEITQHDKIALMEFVLKHGRDHNLDKLLQKLRKDGKLQEMTKEHDASYSQILLKYLIEVSGGKEEVLEAMSGINQQLDSNIMDVRLKWKAEGKAEGKAEHAQRMALSMLKDKAPLEKILKWTGLKKGELEAIKQKQPPK